MFLLLLYTPTESFPLFDLHTNTTYSTTYIKRNSFDLLFLALYKVCLRSRSDRLMQKNIDALRIEPAICSCELPTEIC